MPKDSTLDIIVDGFALARRAPTAKKPKPASTGALIPRGAEVKVIKYSADGAYCRVDGPALAGPVWTAASNLGAKILPSWIAEPGGEFFTVGDRNSIIRHGPEHKSPFGSRRKRAPLGSFVRVLRRQSKYCEVRTVAWVKGELTERGDAWWTVDSNLVPGAAKVKSSNAVWRAGNYLGQAVLLEVPASWGRRRIAYETAPAWFTLINAAADDGVKLTLNSGFRTYAAQSKLRKVWLNERKVKAAVPGYSNHQNGIAFDISVGLGVGNPSGSPKNWGNKYRWLLLNAALHGFERTVNSEAWHWEYRPESAAASDAFGNGPKLKSYLQANPGFAPY